MDLLSINDMDVECIIGVEEWERKETRLLRLQIELECTLQPGAAHDRLDQTLNYDELYHRIRNFVKSSTFFLIEGLAHQVADMCLSYERVAVAKICVEKPGFLVGCRSVSVTIQREK